MSASTSRQPADRRPGDPNRLCPVRHVSENVFLANGLADVIVLLDEEVSGNEASGRFFAS
jgi:hypothetical protein